jgi:hypothetical protein
VRLREAPAQADEDGHDPAKSILKKIMNFLIKYLYRIIEYLLAELSSSPLPPQCSS